MSLTRDIKIADRSLLHSYGEIGELSYRTNQQIASSHRITLIKPTLVQNIRVKISRSLIGACYVNLCLPRTFNPIMKLVFVASYQSYAAYMIAVIRQRSYLRRIYDRCNQIEELHLLEHMCKSLLLLFLSHNCCNNFYVHLGCINQLLIIRVAFAESYQSYAADFVNVFSSRH